MIEVVQLQNKFYQDLKGKGTGVNSLEVLVFQSAIANIKHMNGNNNSNK